MRCSECRRRDEGDEEMLKSIETNENQEPFDDFSNDVGEIPTKHETAVDGADELEE